MEKKTTRRIIGVLVVIALVIILLPLMFNGPDNQSPIQTSEAKAPTFPGMEVEASAATENASMIPPTQSGALINRLVAPSQQQHMPAPVAAETVASNSSQKLSQPAPAADTANYPSAPAPQTANSMLSSSELSSTTGSAADAPMLRPINDLTSANAGENVIVIDSDGDGSTTTLSKALAQADLSKSEMEPTPFQNQAVPAQARTSVMQAQPAAPYQAQAEAKPAAPAAVAAPAANSMVAAITKTETSAKGTVTTTTVTTAKAAPKTHTKVAVAKAAKKPAPAAEVKTVASKEEAANPVADLKKAAWIVQLGSFKNKINAERLTNSLRAKGYKAFTLETKSNGQTRVCVGPEFKQLAASTLAGKIQQDINMRGIVMTYQPLAL